MHVGTPFGWQSDSVQEFSKFPELVESIGYILTFIMSEYWFYCHATYRLLTVIKHWLRGNQCLLLKHLRFHKPLFHRIDLDLRVNQGLLLIPCFDITIYIIWAR